MTGRTFARVTKMRTGQGVREVTNASVVSRATYSSTTPSDTGVAAAEVDDRAARREHAPFLGVADDGPGDAVLHRADRVVRLRLGQYLGARPASGRGATELEKGRVADEFGDLGNR
ncbi:hypothetical protein KIH74_33740 [Kineosporia sp. J2-2]|uniref:Uncharacterized protein n=1 Tax=Kineosporia corallincola TaxID=2835133 RepID=A0ABS5TT09_9ACTN|nr:hypothetical protein [Kineosporia corallincola]MBT0773956.1 hypothetical protein [Kineosporia corallincola]